MLYCLAGYCALSGLQDRLFEDEAGYWPLAFVPRGIIDLVYRFAFTLPVECCLKSRCGRGMMMQSSFELPHLDAFSLEHDMAEAHHWDSLLVSTGLVEAHQLRSALAVFFRLPLSEYNHGRCPDMLWVYARFRSTSKPSVSALRRIPAGLLLLHSLWSALKRAVCVFGETEKRGDYLARCCLAQLEDQYEAKKLAASYSDRFRSAISFVEGDGSGLIKWVLWLATQPTTRFYAVLPLFILCIVQGVRSLVRDDPFRWSCLQCIRRYNRYIVRTMAFTKPIYIEEDMLCYPLDLNPLEAVGPLDDDGDVVMDGTGAPPPSSSSEATYHGSKGLVISGLFSAKQYALQDAREREKVERRTKAWVPSMMEPNELGADHRSNEKYQELNVITILDSE